MLRHTSNWEKISKNEQSSLILLNSQAVKNTDSTDDTWFYHYKCTNGINMLVDVLWIPVLVKVTTANIWDREWWRNLAKENQELLRWIKAMLAELICT